ncbi:methyltransferase domain-containing protein [Ramlibacter tataouinensis]|uniref:class I SAM-dependent methyltransferase n=1 Tax=Ramlibacter tataouinensis TaxID=94132 RepID=UPI0022F38152|nr:methyltransferase domain-containing protein [Ramlibacter tataouinensis]WBY03547.1 methyltransferase domain-containing protein [Ramlibacter tataouinensis]
MTERSHDLPDALRRALALAVPGALSGLLLPAPQAGAQDTGTRRPDVPFVPTPMPVVEKMLQMANVRAGDVVYDLGCGDGRIVIQAAKERGARGVGIDIDPRRIAEARANAKEAGVEERVQFRQADLFQSDFSPASVVTLYLLPDINQRLRPQLWRQLKVGTRVVSHDFDMGDAWPPDRTERAENKTVHLWTIRAEHKQKG